MASELGLMKAQIFLGLLGRLLCPSPGRLPERPWGPEEDVRMLGMGGGHHRPAGAGN